MIGEGLNLKANSLVAVMIPRQTEEESEKFYKELTTKITNEYFPELTGFIQLQDLPKKAHECKTLEDLEKLRYELIPENFFEVMVEKLNSIEELKDTERIYLLCVLSDRIVFAAKQYTNKIFHDRAQRIASEKPKILM